jgi:hypothetical protein
MIAFDENLIALLDSLSRIKSTPLLEKTNRQNDDYYQYSNLNPIC